MKTVIVAARDVWPTEDAVAQIAALIAEIPSVSEIWIRGDAKGNVTSPLERVVQLLANEIGIVVIKARPEVWRGSAGIFRRDYALVSAADRVVAFFNPSAFMGGGTGHVVHAAYQKGLAVEAWSLDGDGTLYQIAAQDAETAEWDGEWGVLGD